MSFPHKIKLQEFSRFDYLLSSAEGTFYFFPKKNDILLNSEFKKFSAIMKKAAQVLKDERELIINTWVDRIKEDVSATRNTSHIVLRDHVPQLLKDIIRVMERFDNFDVVEEEMIYREIFESSVEHGRHRATSQGYSLGQILREYILFDKVITLSLIKNETFSKEAGMVIKYSIENAMLYSAIAFTDSLQEMRHKLIAMVAHDMRNPISASLLAVKALKYEDGMERFEKIREMAITSLERSVDLIEGLLDSVTIQAGEGMTFDFSEQNIIDYLEAVYQEAKQSYSNPFMLDCDEKEILGVFDGTMVRRVLENFVNNAVKYGRDNGPVNLKCKRNGDIVELSVHNEGNPIPAEKQEAIFEFLSTSEGVGPLGLKSRGIGLFLVKAVAEAHSGELRLKSTAEEGTTFSITLHRSIREPGKFREVIKTN